MDNDSDAWNDDDNIEENDTSAEGSSSNASNTFDFDTWAEWYAWSSRNDGTEEAALLLSMLMEEHQSHAQPRMPRPQHNIGLRGYQYIIAVLNGHPDTCYEMFRMEVYAFRTLCDRLRRDASLRDSSREVTVEEALGMFCYTVGHGVVQRNAANLFQHSVETINRHVYNVMRALCRLSRSVIKPSQTTGVMPYIEGNPRRYPWFEKCHGAMDGVMIDAAAPGSIANAYLNRYHRITQNVLCVCDFDMKFTFVYAGWEGTAHDARVLIDALSRPGNHFPWPEEGYYYLIDSTFPCTKGFMPPYPRVRYHRSERRGSRTFQGYKDLFNYRHSSLRNVIERTFGVLKKRFRILNLMPPYLLTRQRYLIIACCTLHNFIRTFTRNDRDFLLYSNPDDYPGMDADQNTSEEFHVPDMLTASAQAMAATRDDIAFPMWEHTYGQQGNT